MQELLDTAIPAVVLVPLVIVGVGVWLCFQQSVKTSKERRAEFLRLHRLAVEENERAEREVEQDYIRQRQADVYRVDYRRRAAAESDHRSRVEIEQEPWRQSEAEFRRKRQTEEEEQRRKQAEVEEYRRKQAEAEVYRQRKQAEAEENRRAQAEAEENRRKQAEEANQRKQAEEANQRKQAEVEAYNRRKQAEAEEARKKQAEAEDQKRREVEEEIKRRQAEDEEKKRRQAEAEEKKRRQAELDAQVRKEAEEESRRKQAEDEANHKRKEDEALKQHEAVKIGEKKHPVSHLICIVCQNRTKRRCSRCKGVYYCSKSCQLQHWSEGHKYECRAPDSSSSPGSSEGDTRNFSDVLSPRSSRSDNISDTLSVDEIGAPSLSPTLSPAPAYATSALSLSAPVSPQPGSLLKTSSTVSADGRRLKPKKILFPYDYFVKLFDREISFPPCGLLNCGNSCYANVVLQCLTFTQPLAAYLLGGDHRKYCRRADWCFMCELQEHVARVKQSQSPLSPIKILSRIRNIGNHLGYGRQEDAHEFMRLAIQHCFNQRGADVMFESLQKQQSRKGCSYQDNSNLDAQVTVWTWDVISFAIDSMQSICLDGVGGEKAADASTQETTLIHYIFGGQLQSQVKCMQCLHESNRYENMMDLAVEIQGNAESLEDALAQFTAAEKLDGDNKYKCDRCNAYVEARKQITVHEAPNILIVTLKRFKSGKFGKLNKQVTFPEVLDIEPYMSGKGDKPPCYRLYAVVVHVDMLNASYFGHYICLVKNPRGFWYQVDDAQGIIYIALVQTLGSSEHDVSKFGLMHTSVKDFLDCKVNLHKVTKQRAYMLLYIRERQDLYRDTRRSVAQGRSSARPASFTDGDSFAQVSPAAQNIYVADRCAVPSEPQQTSLYTSSMIFPPVSDWASPVYVPPMKICSLVPGQATSLHADAEAAQARSQSLSNGTAYVWTPEPLNMSIECVLEDPLVALQQIMSEAEGSKHNEDGIMAKHLGSIRSPYLLEDCAGTSKLIVTTNKFVTLPEQSLLQFAEYVEALSGNVEHRARSQLPEQPVYSAKPWSPERGSQALGDEGLSLGLSIFDYCEGVSLREGIQQIEGLADCSCSANAMDASDLRLQLYNWCDLTTSRTDILCGGLEIDVEKEMEAAAMDPKYCDVMSSGWGARVLRAENLGTYGKNISSRDGFLEVWRTSSQGAVDVKACDQTKYSLKGSKSSTRNLTDCSGPFSTEIITVGQLSQELELMKGILGPNLEPQQEVPLVAVPERSLFKSTREKLRSRSQVADVNAEGGTGGAHIDSQEPGRRILLWSRMNTFSLATNDYTCHHVALSGPDPPVECGVSEDSFDLQLDDSKWIMQRLTPVFAV